MATIELLGSSNTLADAEHDSVYMFVSTNDGEILIDCAGSPVQRLAKAGTDITRLERVILTHDHADHIYGIPILVQAMMLYNWNGTWDKPLTIAGLESTLNTVRGLISHFELTDRVQVEYQEIPPQSSYLVYESDEIRILTTPVQHSRPTIGVRVENKRTNNAVVYSSATSPCEEVKELARGSAVLIHEANSLEEFEGHSTPRQAAEIALEAEVSRLVLVHYDPQDELDVFLEDAKSRFQGPVEMGYDGMKIEF